MCGWFGWGGGVCLYVLIYVLIQAAVKCYLFLTVWLFKFALSKWTFLLRKFFKSLACAVLT